MSAGRHQQMAEKDVCVFVFNFSKKCRLPSEDLQPGFWKRLS